MISLFDSIVRGYPVGSLLLWEQEAPEQMVTLGSMSIHAPAGDVFFVVDGQQRLTALASALTESGWSGQFAVGYDLDNERFAARPRRSADTWVPSHVLYDLTTLLTWFRARPELMDRFDAAAGVSKALRDLRFHAYVVRQDDEEVLRDIFDRVNNAGKKLTRGEVFAALHQSGGGTSEGTARWVGEQVELRTRFGALDGGTVMQVVLARRGADVSREIRNEFESDARGRDAFAAGESAVEAHRAAADAAVKAIEFLQQDVGVPHLAFVPHQYLFVAFVRFFAHHPSPSPRHTRLLRRFFWRAAVNGPKLVPGSTTGVSRMINRRVVPHDELASVSGLMAMVSGPPPAYPTVQLFRTNTAATKMLLCAMWGHGPRGLVTGQLVDGDELRAALGDRSTAADVIAPILSGRRTGGHDGDAGNRLLLVPAEDEASDVLELLSAAGEDALASHLLGRDDVRALAEGDGSSLIRARTERLEQLFRVFLDRMCEWEQEDTPDLEMLVGAEEAAGAPV